MIDSHCHLDSFSEEELNFIFTKAPELGITHFINVETNFFNEKTLELAEKLPNVYTTIGLHPEIIQKNEPQVADYLKLPKNPKIVAIGEIGFDNLFYNDVSFEKQKERFIIQLRVAKKMHLPIIVHCRGAYEEVIAILKAENITHGVIHCFTGTYDIAQKFLDLGFYLSFSGILTFKKALELQEVAKKIPLNKILIETDSPYLAPVPLRGTKNMPQNVYYVAKFLSVLKDIDFDQIAKATTQNCRDLFHLF